jgi:hypothetical protein
MMMSLFGRDLEDLFHAIHQTEALLPPRRTRTARTAHRHPRLWIKRECGSPSSALRPEGFPQAATARCETRTGFRCRATLLDKLKSGHRALRPVTCMMTATFFRNKKIEKKKFRKKDPKPHPTTSRVSREARRAEPIPGAHIRSSTWGDERSFLLSSAPVSSTHSGATLSR